MVVNYTSMDGKLYITKVQPIQGARRLLNKLRDMTLRGYRRDVYEDKENR